MDEQFVDLEEPHAHFSMVSVRKRPAYREGWRDGVDAGELRGAVGFGDINTVLPYEEREAIVKVGARVAVYSITQVDRA